MEQIGNVKIKVSFAWLPDMMDNGKFIWLTYYKKVYKYEESERCIKNSYPVISWNLIEKNK
jgi:hypothetical protein